MGERQRSEVRRFTVNIQKSKDTTVVIARSGETVEGDVAIPVPLIAVIVTTEARRKRRKTRTGIQNISCSRRFITGLEGMGKSVLRTGCGVQRKKPLKFDAGSPYPLYPLYPC